MVKAFPILAADEFAEACSQLEADASGRLDGTHWLGVTWDKEGTLHIKNQCQVEEQRHRNDDKETNQESELIEPEDEFILSRPPTASTVIVDFSVVISPTYQVPMLWFIFAGLPKDGPQGIDAVYQYLVPSTSRAQLKNMGVLGGISIANDLVSGMPAFFIHPCNTQEALLSLQPGNGLSSYQYLLLWLGLIGPSVGLYMPSRFVSLGK